MNLNPSNNSSWQFYVRDTTMPRFRDCTRCEMRISDNKWCIRAVCDTKIWHRAILLPLNKCQTRTSENWKRVCIVLCCCVQYVDIYTEQRAFADGINFGFHLNKTAAESYRLLREAYGGEHASSQDTCKRWCWRLFCSMLAQTFGYREMNFQCHVLYSKRKHVRSNSLYSKHLTRS